MPVRGMGNGALTVSPRYNRAEQTQLDRLAPTRWRAKEDIIPFPQRPDDRGWRAIGRTNLGRDLPPDMHNRMIRQAYLAYRMNPMAHRLIDMMVNFIMGSGITLASDNPEILAEALRFWNNGFNNWPAKIERRLRDLHVYGEWLHRPLISEKDQTVYICDWQPDAVTLAVADKYTSSEIETLYFREMVVNQTAVKDYPVQPIRRRLMGDPSSSFSDGVTLGPLMGDVFHFGINRTGDALRGVSTLFPLLDYLDVHDDILFSRAEKIQMMSHIYFDLKIEGMNEEEIRRYMAEETAIPPRPGSVYAHNEAATLEMVTPDLKADDASTDVSMLKSHIVSSFGFPGTWFDDPGTAGRAVGAEMAEPALKAIIALQCEVGEMIRQELAYVFAQAFTQGRLGADAGTEFTVSFSKPSTRDWPRIGAALSGLSDFLTAQNQALLEPAESRRILVNTINQLGITDVPLDVTLPVALKELADKAHEDKLNPPGPIVVAPAPGGSGANSPAAQMAKSKSKAAEAVHEAQRRFGVVSVGAGGKISLLARSS